ncbi:MAG: DDE-type integrase/transposase/recombinase [Rhodocyclaceae bacterium]|nr:DDE-type integrase/transposase/recombinase [Rhodocyclaceae bacterium]
MGPAELATFSALAARLDAADRGDRGAIAAAEAARLGMSVQTLYRRLSGLRATVRKRRADAGTSSVRPDEAMQVANVLRQAQRANGKQLLSTADAAEILRANGRAAIGRVDADSGEVVPVSTSTVRRALRTYGLDRRSLSQPEPHIRMASKHPNHVWQVDASICVLYYLDHGGVGVMHADEFYKNRPESFQRRARDMVVRYLVTDHYSGAFHLRYFQGADSAVMLSDFLLEAITPKADPQRMPLHGVPLMLIGDPGAMNTAGTTRNLMERLMVQFQPHQPRNPRAKGSVETHHNIIERAFEGRLMFHRVADLAQLNREADTWSAHFQSIKPHGRHGHTRYGLWQTIRPEQLRIAPPLAVCRDLFTSAPEPRRVRPDLTISYAVRGHGAGTYCVRHICGVNVGDTLQVAINPYRLPDVVVIEQGEGGRPAYFPCERLAVTEAGFEQRAPVFGERHASAPHTPAVRAVQAMDAEAYQAADGQALTPAEREKARRSREPAFGGALDSVEYLAQRTTPAFMPRRGVDLGVRAPVVESPLLSPVEVAMRLRHAGVPYAWIAARYPDGAREDLLDSVIAAFGAEQSAPRAADAAG